MDRIYPASKLWHWEKWLQWEEACCHDIKLNARWINMMRSHKTEEKLQEYTTPEYAAYGWYMNMEDIKTSDFLVVYSDNDTLRGALIEVGMAMALGTPIILVGNSPSYSEWVDHWSVKEHVNDLDDVVSAINSYKKGW